MTCESNHNTKAIYFSEGQQKQNNNGMPSSFNPTLCCPLCWCLWIEIFLPSSWVYLFTFGWGMTVHTN